MVRSEIVSTADIRDRIRSIIPWKSGERRALHKPLQLLLMVANIQNGGPRLVPFAEMEDRLRTALATFGPVRKSNHPEYPFWHLQSDGIWEVQGDDEIVLRRNSANPTAKQLREKKALGGFLLQDFNALRMSLTLQNDVIHDILDTHFPASVHGDIIDFFGLFVGPERTEPYLVATKFRHDVLRAYNGVCAISNFSLRIDNAMFGIEPAHILWPQAGGRSIVRNAVAMTTLHRNLFHLGMFTIDPTYRIRLAKVVRGGNGFNDLLGKFEGKPISLPVAAEDHPDQEALRWHQNEVFRH